MNIWTGPSCLAQDISKFDEERAFKPEALKKRNFNEKRNLGRSMRRNNHRPLPTLASLNPNSLFGGVTPQKRRKEKRKRGRMIGRGGNSPYETNNNKNDSFKPMPTINTARSDKASPETARALPFIGKQNKNQTVILKYDKENTTPTKGGKRDGNQQKKWYEKKNDGKKKQTEKQQNVMAAPGKKKKVLTTEPATPTRLDLGNETIGTNNDNDVENRSNSINNFLNGNAHENNAKILTTPFQQSNRESKMADDDDDDDEEEGKFEEKVEKNGDYQANNEDYNNNNNNTNEQEAEEPEEQEDVWEGYDHSHLEGREYVEGDGQIQYDEYGGYYDEHGQYYDSHGGYYDENGEYVYPENYQHDDNGHYENHDMEGKEQEVYDDNNNTNSEGKTSDDYDENYQHNDNHNNNTTYKEMDQHEGRYTPYKHGRKPNVSPLRSPYPRNDNTESKSNDDADDDYYNNRGCEGKEQEKEQEEEGATARRVRTMFQSDRSPAQTLTGRNRVEKKFRPKTPSNMEKQQSKQTMQKSMRPGAGRRFVRRGKGNSNKNNNKSVGNNYEVNNAWAVVFSRARHGRIEEVRTALENGMPVNARDPHGNTLVMVACQNGQKRIVKLALRYNAELNLRNRSGNTALHFCFMYAYYNLGEYLISKGADDQILNLSHQNCYEAGESGPSGL